VTLEDELRSAHEAFYRAFRERDMAALEQLWAEEAPVACLHPGLGVLQGRAAVLRSWRGILDHPKAPVLHSTNAHVSVLGTSAYVTCLAGRPGEPPRLVTTNVFTMERGRWRLVLHHCAPLAPDALKRRDARDPHEDPFRLN